MCSIDFTARPSALLHCNFFDLGKAKNLLMKNPHLRLTPHHFRDRGMREVDIVLERDDGMIAAIEVKASAKVKASDFSGLRALAEACGHRFAFGVVMYDSTDVVPFGDRLAAAPLSSLWR